MSCVAAALSDAKFKKQIMSVFLDMGANNTLWVVHTELYHLQVCWTFSPKDIMVWIPLHVGSQDAQTLLTIYIISGFYPTDSLISYEISATPIQLIHTRSTRSLQCHHICM